MGPVDTLPAIEDDDDVADVDDKLDVPIHQGGSCVVGEDVLAAGSSINSSTASIVHHFRPPSEKRGKESNQTLGNVECL